MKSYKYKVLAFGMALASVASCSDSFLDKTPDERDRYGGKGGTASCISIS